MKKTPLRRKTRVKPVNRKRRQSEFARCYGSKARVAFVKSLRCVLHVHGPCVGPIDNAHTNVGGMGRKADYTHIVPLCRSHHRDYDEHRGVCASHGLRTLIALHAAVTEMAWQAHIA